MELQLVEIYAPKGFNHLDKLKQDFSLISYWVSDEKENRIRIRILVEKENAEQILTYLEKVSKENKKFQAMLFSVKAFVPKEYHEKNKSHQKGYDRASKHELYSVVNTSSQINVGYIWFTVFAAIVAAVGIIQNSPIFIIGANVIDPTISPILGISFSSVLGDRKLIKKSMVTSLCGLSIPFTISVLFGFFFPLPTNSETFLSQTNVLVIDIIVAVAAGGAGALSFIKRSYGKLVGVMVSLTVLPPMVVLGMMIGAAEWESALMPLLKLLVNINSILLSAIIVFWISGIKPTNWSEIKEASTSRTFSLTFTGIIGLILLGTVVFLHF